MMSMPFMSGAIMMACLACGLFFFKFWRLTKDRLFLLFSLAFWTLTLERFVLVFLSSDLEMRYSVYLFRLAAFVLIALAIADKNRARNK